MQDDCSTVAGDCVSGLLRSQAKQDSAVTMPLRTRVILGKSSINPSYC